jgi:lipopolysaccharide export system protein LptA
LKRNTLSLLLMLTALGLGVGVVHAEKADKDKPLNIESDKLDYDDLKQISIFTGRVSLIKGTIDMRGERLEVRQDPDGFQYAWLTPAEGSRATYKQKRDLPNETVEGAAQKIEYDGKLDKVYLVGNAELKKFRSGALSDSLTGQRIVYENLTDKFSVDGRIPQNLAGQNNALTPATTGNSGRVKAIFSPVKASEAKP